MTWTKLGEEWPDVARDLSDAAYRTHTEALCWSNRRQLDLLIPKRDLRRFGETSDPDTAVKELVASGWWEDRGDAWHIGLRFSDWQLESAVISQRREASALRSRRSRLHQAGDHGLCLPTTCAVLKAGDASRHASPGTERNGTERTGESAYGTGSQTETQQGSDDWPETKRPGSGSYAGRDDSTGGPVTWPQPPSTGLDGTGVDADDVQQARADLRRNWR